ncbi:MAG: internal scaffolding protein [Microvirus sp.]|nr:MAG: internal scaffolding protein [Microvirus sp.]
MKSGIKWRNQNDPERDQLEADKCITYCDDDSLTQQHFTESADLNTIVKRFGLDQGALPPVPLDPAYYGDVSDVPDLRTVLDIAHDARERFAALPPKLRARFANRADNLWDFVNDPENADEAIRLGLLKREETPQPPPDTPKSKIDNGVSTGT